MERIRTGTRMPAVTRVRLGVRVRAHVRCSDVTGERRGPQTQGDAWEAAARAGAFVCEVNVLDCKWRCIYVGVVCMVSKSLSLWSEAPTSAHTNFLNNMHWNFEHQHDPERQHTALRGWTGSTTWSYNGVCAQERIEERRRWHAESKAKAVCLGRVGELGCHVQRDVPRLNTAFLRWLMCTRAQWSLWYSGTSAKADTAWAATQAAGAREGGCSKVGAAREETRSVELARINNCAISCQ